MPSTSVPSDERKLRTAQLLAEAVDAEPAHRAVLLDEVIVLNIPVAHALASRYRNRGQPREELEQVACLALTKAVQNFDPARGDDEVGCTTEDVLEAYECATLSTPDSLHDTPPGGDAGFAWIDRLPTEELGFQRSEAVAVLAPACKRLKMRDRQILRMRFYEQKTQQQIADELGVTQVQVSRLLQRILTDLKKEITGRRRRATTTKVA